jgi:hypothetical protein
MNEKMEEIALEEGEVETKKVPPRLLWRRPVTKKVKRRNGFYLNLPDCHCKSILEKNRKNFCHAGSSLPHAGKPTLFPPPKGGNLSPSFYTHLARCDAYRLWITQVL